MNTNHRMKAGPYILKAYTLTFRFNNFFFIFPFFFFFFLMAQNVLKNIKVSKPTEFQEFGVLTQEHSCCTCWTKEKTIFFSSSSSFFSP